MTVDDRIEPGDRCYQETPTTLALNFRRCDASHQRNTIIIATMMMTVIMRCNDQVANGTRHNRDVHAHTPTYRDRRIQNIEEVEGGFSELFEILSASSLPLLSPRNKNICPPKRPGDMFVFVIVCVCMCMCGVLLRFRLFEMCIIKDATAYYTYYIAAVVTLHETYA